MLPLFFIAAVLFPSATYAEEDPRIELVRLQAADRLEEALDAVQRLRAIESDRKPAGLDYLEGHLLAKLRRTQEAVDAFATVIGSDSPLREHARLRVAQLQEELGFPRVAAALATEVLSQAPSSSLRRPALELLARSIESGGDCRLLDRLGAVRFTTPEGREIELLRARCVLAAGALEAGALETARERLLALLTESTKDLVAFMAADLLYPLVDTESADPATLLLGQTYYYHRRFDRSIALLRLHVPVQSTPVRSQRDFNTHFQWVRGLFWQEQFEQAAKGYGELAERSVSAQHKAQARYHQARSLELADHWRESVAAYVQAFDAQPLGSSAGSSLLGALRLHSRSHRDALAQQFYERLGTRAGTRDERILAALFLASSSLSQNKVGGVGAWLEDAEGRGPTVESLYWRGRLAELEGEPDQAISRYLEALEMDYFHPLSQNGLARLDTTELRTRAVEMGQALTRRSDRLFSTWVLLGSQNDAGQEARAALESEWARKSRQPELVPVSSVTTEAWPLWQGTLANSEDLLLALGIWSESDDAARRWFPISKPNLAFTAATELQRASRTRDGLLIAESLAKGLPKGTPDPIVPAVFRKTLYPRAYQFLIEQAARHFKVDPLLLSAIIREESRFEPKAASNAAARGLTQFIIPTAERFALGIGFDDLTPNDLERPEVAVALGAAYLEELSERFDGRPEQMLAAYNAGEAQAEAWGRHCLSRDPAEYLTKVSFSETRAYVIKVLRSYAQYRDLYPEGAP